MSACSSWRWPLAQGGELAGAQTHLSSTWELTAFAGWSQEQDEVHWSTLCLSIKTDFITNKSSKPEHRIQMYKVHWNFWNLPAIGSVTTTTTTTTTAAAEVHVPESHKAELTTATCWADTPEVDAGGVSSWGPAHYYLICKHCSKSRHVARQFPATQPSIHLLSSEDNTQVNQSDINKVTNSTLKKISALVNLVQNSSFSCMYKIHQIYTSIDSIKKIICTFTIKIMY